MRTVEVIVLAQLALAACCQLRGVTPRRPATTGSSRDASTLARSRGFVCVKETFGQKSGRCEIAPWEVENMRELHCGDNRENCFEQQGTWYFAYLALDRAILDPFSSGGPSCFDRLATCESAYRSAMSSADVRQNKAVVTECTAVPVEIYGESRLFGLMGDPEPPVGLRDLHAAWFADGRTRYFATLWSCERARPARVPNVSPCQPIERAWCQYVRSFPNGVWQAQCYGSERECKSDLLDYGDAHKFCELVERVPPTPPVE